MHHLQLRASVSGIRGPISRRQHQVLALLTHGMTNAAIARELGVSLDGAKWHVSELLTVLGMETRQEAARWYRDYAEAAVSA